MPENNNIQQYTAADIEKYQKGLLSPKEMHTMEKAALDDPFLADAMEGYSAVDTTVQNDIQELQTRLHQRVEQPKVVPLIPRNSSSIPWLRIAALFILLAGAGFLAYQIGFKPKQNTTVAQQDNADKESAVNKPIPLQENNADTNTLNSFSNQNAPATELPAARKKAVIKAIEETNTFQEADIVANDFNRDMASPASDSSLMKRMPGIQVEQSAPPTANASKADDGKYFFNTDNRTAGGVDKTVAKKSFDKAKVQGFSAPYKPNIFRGRVQDANNAALPFANITNTKDNVGTYSDANGYFVLTSPDSVLNVQVRSLGYNNSSVQLRNLPSGNNIVLQDDNHQMDEIIVSNRNANSSRSRSNTRIMEEPEPVDGWENYDTYIANNLVMPDILKSKATNRGEVELSFEVDKDGRPVNITVVKSLCESCDQEAIRLVKEGPRFKQKARRKGRTFVTVSF